MDKCQNCKRRQHRIACLKCESEAEAQHKIVLPEIIKPMVKDVPLADLKDRQKATLILHTIGEMSYRRISHLFGLHHSTVSSILKETFKNLRKLKKPQN